MARVCVLFLCAAAGCATTSNRTAEKVLGYTDHDHFAVEHHDSGHGGRIVGTVCAVDIKLDASQLRGGVRLVGEVAAQPAGGQALPMALETHDGFGERDITGTVGLVQRSRGIELKLSRAAVTGKVGERRFDLHALGDDYVGSLQIAETRMPFVLRGAQQMWAMPAAAQASILPLLLSCSTPDKVIQVVDLRDADKPAMSPPPGLLAPRPPFVPAGFDRGGPRYDLTPRDPLPEPRQTPTQHSSV